MVNLKNLVSRLLHGAVEPDWMRDLRQANVRESPANDAMVTQAVEPQQQLPNTDQQMDGQTLVAPTTDTITAVAEPATLSGHIAAAPQVLTGDAAVRHVATGFVKTLLAKPWWFKLLMGVGLVVGLFLCAIVAFSAASGSSANVRTAPQPSNSSPFGSAPTNSAPVSPFGAAPTNTTNATAGAIPNASSVLPNGQSQGCVSAGSTAFQCRYSGTDSNGGLYNWLAVAVNVDPRDQTFAAAYVSCIRAKGWESTWQSNVRSGKVIPLQFNFDMSGCP